MHPAFTARYWLIIGVGASPADLGSASGAGALDSEASDSSGKGAGPDNKTGKRARYGRVIRLSHYSKPPTPQRTIRRLSTAIKR